MGEFICAEPSCGKSFKSNRGHAGPRYCSRSCANRANYAERERPPVTPRKYTDEQLIAALQDLAEKLGHTPSKAEIATHLHMGDVLRRRFGSHNRAVALAGLVPNKQWVSGDDLDGIDYIGPKVRFSVLLRDGFKCQYCGAGPEQGRVLEVDHKVPRSKGGSNDLENLITACSVCNRGKMDLLLEHRAVAQR